MRLACSTWIAVAASVSCSKASDEAKQLQESAPPSIVAPPDNLSIAVSIDGSAASPITADTLKSTKPDFVDPERRAWLVATLVPAASPLGSIVKASGPNGMSVDLTHPMPGGLEPVLYLTCRGEVIVAAVDPKSPFPEFHGRGGRLHRPGDSLPHVAPVSALSIEHPRYD